MMHAESSAPERRTEALVVDASAIVEALLGTELGVAARARMRGCELHAPAHLDAEALSALGRLQRAGDVSVAAVGAALNALAAAPIERHALASSLKGAWERRDRLRLVDALYVELATALGSLTLLTTDARLARASELAEPVGGA